MPAKKRNAGPGSYRQSKKSFKKQMGLGRTRKHDLQHHFIARGRKPLSRKKQARRDAYDNPQHLLFSTKSQALAYARSHGIPKSRFSLKRMKKAR